MATIADNIAELMRIRLEMKEFAKIPDDVPFEQYGAWLAWVGSDVPAQPLMADFVNKRYSMDGVPCRFEDIFEFERLSKAWLFDEELKEYEVGEARVSRKGLLVEQESTNLIYDFAKDAITTRCSIERSGRLFTMQENPGHITTYFAHKGFDAPKGLAGVDSVFFRVGDLKENPAEFKVGIGASSVIIKGRSQSVIYDNVSDSFLKGPDGHLGHGVTPVGDLLRLWGSGETKTYYLNFFIGVSSDVHPSSILACYPQRESGTIPSSVILSEDSPTTRLPETLSLKNPDQPVIVDADEGIIQDKGTFTGFGHIRKIEVK